MAPSWRFQRENKRLRAGPPDQVVDLDPGDYAMFAGDVAHRYEALAAGTAAVLVMEHV